jgi:hypothetical protein
MKLQALLLTGGLAVGKTAVAQEVVAIAGERGLPVAAVDLDWLSWASGANLSADELISQNLAGVAANYTAAGIARLVLSRALVAATSLVAVVQALPGWSLVVVRLDAPRATVESRLRARDSGSELEVHLGQIEAMRTLTSMVAPDAPVVVNDRRTPREVAVEVMRIAGWIENSRTGVD